ncbi:MAG: hypothetical protein R2728_05270 [Chitinophagales bacterium]
MSTVEKQALRFCFILSFICFITALILFISKKGFSGLQFINVEGLPYSGRIDYQVLNDISLAIIGLMLLLLGLFMKYFAFDNDDLPE